MSRKLWCCALVAAVGVSAICRQSFAQQAGPPGAAADAKPITLLELEARIDSALGEVTNLSFTEQPLADVVAYVKERHKIAVQLDATALDTAGVTSDTPVTIDVEGITLRSALNLMLKSIELTYCVRDGVLLVTTSEEADNHLVTEVYDARHFLYVADKHGARKRDAKFLFDLISTHVQPTCWTDVGGTGAIELLDRGAVVSQAWSVQQEVGQFMQAVEKAYEQHRQGAFNQTIEVGPAESSSTQAVGRALAEETSLQFTEQPLQDVVHYIKERHKIEIQLDTAALDTAGVTNDTPVEIDVEGLPLSNALNLMLGRLELTYFVADEVLLISTSEEIDNRLITRIYPVKDLLEAETQASGQVAIGEQVAPGTESLPPGAGGASPYGPPGGSPYRGRSGGSPYGGARGVGTPYGGSAPATAGAGDQPDASDVQSAAEQRVAAAQALAEAKAAEERAASTRRGGGSFPGMAPQREKVSPAADRIIETILDAIEPTTWTDVGGTGSITFVPQFEGIVVSQTGACHAQIDDLLARLRKLSLIQQATAEESPVADGGSELSLRAYHVTQHSGAGQPVKDVSSLAQLIQRVVEPQSWQQAERPAFVHVVDDALMIQATNETHDRIVKLLEQLDLAPEPKKPQQGRGGTSGGGGGF